MLHIDLLGPPRLFWKCTPLRISRLQTRCLLFRLASEQAAHSREALCYYFWPDISDATAKRRFTRLVYDLRSNLPCPNIVILDPETIHLNQTLVSTDLQAFEQTHKSKVTNPDELQPLLSNAINLYRGDFLQGVSLTESSEYELWLTESRQLWANRFLAMLQQLIEMEIAAGRYWAAIENLLHYLHFDELNENIHRLLMLQYLAIGNRLAAIRQFERCADLLWREIGVLPDDTVREIYSVALRAG